LKTPLYLQNVVTSPVLRHRSLVRNNWPDFWDLKILEYQISFPIRPNIRFHYVLESFWGWTIFEARQVQFYYYFAILVLYSKNRANFFFSRTSWRINRHNGKLSLLKQFDEFLVKASYCLWRPRSCNVYTVPPQKAFHVAWSLSQWNCVS